MKPSKTALLYVAYIIGVSLFFLWYLFPSDTLKDYLAYRLSQGNPEVAVTIERISPILPPGIKLHKIDFSHQNRSLIEVESLRVMPGLKSLFSDTAFVDFKGRFYDGTLRGRAEIQAATNGSDINIDGNIAGVRVKQIGALQQIFDHAIAGKLDADFAYADSPAKRNFSAQLTMHNCRLELATAVFNQELFEFKNIDANLALQNKILTIKEISATGNQLDLNIAGKMILNQSDPAKYKLDLKGSVTPHHLFLAQIEKDVPIDWLRHKKTGQTAIGFKVDGTIGDPGFSLN